MIMSWAFAEGRRSGPSVNEFLSTRRETMDNGYGAVAI